jgi:hypothetical protein
LIIEFHNRLGQPQRVEVTRVVVYDKHGNPIALAVEYDTNVTIAETLSPGNEHAFHAMLRNLGIDRTVVVHETPQIALPQIRFPKQ